MNRAVHGTRSQCAWMMIWGMLGGAIIGGGLSPKLHWAAEPAIAVGQEDLADELPRIAPLEPEAALASFKLVDGFRMELAAAEPDVVDPVAICFDERGRMFVCEMRGYSENREDKLSRIRLLEDLDHDGRFEKSSVFAEGLQWPTAIFYTDGGLLVADAPDILWLQDRDGDGKADTRQKHLTGFGTENVQGLLNSFQWGLDNRIYGATSSSGGLVHRPDGVVTKKPADKPLNLRGRDFAIDPQLLTIESITGGGQHGATFNDWGDRFVCSNSDHLQQIVLEERYLARNPYLAVPAARKSIAADGPQADVFRRSPVEPWREVRTRLRVSGKAPGPIERGGLASGYFTSASGVTVFRGNGWPAEFQGTVFIADVGSNLIHRKRLMAEGVLWRGERVDDKSEFLASTDNWFRPVQMANGPDGCLYVCDMYREVIEHPNSLPPIIKQHLDLSSRGRGRIYRIVPEAFDRPAPPRLESAPVAKLVAALDHPNAWHRETAARLIYERQIVEAAPPLRELVSTAKTPQGRLQALYALDGLKQLSAEVLEGLLREVSSPAGCEQPGCGRGAENHARLREHAIRLSEGHLGDNHSPGLRLLLPELVEEEDAHVRLQLSLTLGALANNAKRNRALVSLVRQDPDDEWLRIAVLSSLHFGSGDVLARLTEDRGLGNTAGGRKLLQALAAQIGKQQRPEDVSALLGAVSLLARQAAASEQAAAMLRITIEAVAAPPKSELHDQLRRATGGELDQLFAQQVATARRTVSNREAEAKQRAAAVSQLRFGDFGDLSGLLPELLQPNEPAEVQAAVLTMLGSLNEPQIAPLLIEAYPGFSPQFKSQAADLLCSQPKWSAALLDAIEQKQIAAADLSPAHWQTLTNARQEGLRGRAVALAASVRPAERTKVVADYRESLTTAGDTQRGAEVFKRTCAACHKVGGIGQEIGPNLAAMKQRGREAILVNVLDPNREVNPQFLNYAVQLHDGRALSGMIAAETANSLTLRRAENAQDTILRIDIEQLKSSGQSLMPEGLEKQIDKRAMADLLAFLMSSP